MNTTTLHVSLPSSLKEFVRTRVGEKSFSNPSDYVRTLIREDQERHEEERLESILLKGLTSGDAVPMGRKEWNKLRNEFRTRLNTQSRNA